MQHLESLLEEGRSESMLEDFYREVVRMSEEEITAVKTAPTWPARVAAAHTVPRELRAFGASQFDPRAAAKITVPVLLLVELDSPDEVRADPQLVAAVLPDARIRTLQGEAHIAHVTAPRTLAEAVIAFLRG